MLLKTSLGSAYVHNIDLIDKSKEIILFIPGAGMDHRVADLLHPDPKIFNQLSQKNSPYEGLTWGSLSDTDLGEALGTGDWNPTLARSTWRKFLKGCGVKNSDICTPEMISAVKERIWRLYGPAALPDIDYDLEAGWQPPQWKVYGGDE